MPLSEPPERQIVDFYMAYQRDRLGNPNPVDFAALSTEKQKAYKEAAAAYNAALE
jgi:hypothetical protein